MILKSADQAAVKRESPTPATSVGDALDLPRQRASYYLQELEKEGLVEFVEERRTGNCMERVLRATARHYLITPVVGDLAALTNGFLSKPA